MSDQLSLAIEHLQTGSLLPNNRNARTHSKRQIRQIAESIRTFGFANPILISGDNVILAGHGRWEAAKLLKLSEVPTIRLDHLTDDQIRAYVIADNRLAEKAGWDKTILAIELQHLAEITTEFDVSVTGFDMAEVDFIVDHPNEEEAPSLGEPDETSPPTTKRGDLWHLGHHRVLCADALEAASYRSLMQGKQAQLIFTDPPYDVPIDGHVSGKGRVRHREFVMASGEMNSGEFTDFLTRICTLLAGNSDDGSIHFIFMDWRHARELLNAGQTAYQELKNICVWVKHNAGMGSLWRSQHELVFVFKHGRRPHQNNILLGRYGRHRTNVWAYQSINNFGRPDEEGNLAAIHPTVKPVNLVADAILDCSARGDIVLDPFLGSGTTLIAAERVGRYCYGLEIDPIYVDAIIRRWQQYTGRCATIQSTGQTFEDITKARAVQHV